jgi:hypothetical protein
MNHESRDPFRGELLSREEWVNLAELAGLVGFPRELIAEIHRLELIEPCVEHGEPCFHVSSLPRVRKILRLYCDLNVSLSSMPLVLDLLERIEVLEHQLDRLISRGGYRDFR